ncbi:MAG: N-acetylneuraminate synthase family protein, partial [Caldimonas sp.]
VNHNGSAELALQLVDVAARCGADAVKFQTFRADKLVRRGAAKAAYQEAATGAGDQHGMLQALEMPEALHRQLFDRCTALGIEFMSTPFDEEAADFLVALGMRRLKVPSGEITNDPFLRHLVAKDMPLILSTGMASLGEIEQAVALIRGERARLGFGRPLAEMLCILHCTSNYPASVDDVHLRAMQTIATATGLPVGYSDHTLGVAVSTAAVALGARVIEKHFTLDTALAGPDHKASLSPEELERLVSQIRVVERALGSAVKQPTASELPVRALVRRSVTTTRDLPQGAILRAGDLCLLRPGTGIAPRDLGTVVGRSLRTALASGSTLRQEDLA